MGKYTPAEGHPWRRYADMNRQQRGKMNGELSRTTKVLICQRVHAGERPQDLALEFGISAAYVRKIKVDWVDSIERS